MKTNNNKINNQPVWKKAYLSLRQYIADSVAKNKLELPTENRLARRLNVSRTSLRHALSQLEMETVITRRKKLGTTINKKIWSLKRRLDIECEYVNLLQRLGFEPSILTADFETLPADQTMAQNLGIEVGEPYLRLRKVFAGNGKPLIFCQNCVAVKNIKISPVPQDYFYNYTIFDFLEDYCQKKLEYEISEIKPIILDQDPAKLLQATPGKQLAYHFIEKGFSQAEQQIIYAEEWHQADTLTYQIVRKETIWR